jgi:DNA-binding winged helix-turn-helix (wHTH) protein
MLARFLAREPSRRYRYSQDPQICHDVVPTKSEVGNQVLSLSCEVVQGRQKSVVEAPGTYRFGPIGQPDKYVFVEGQGLLCSGSEVDVDPKVLTVLGVLVSLRSQKVTGKQMVAAVYGPIYDCSDPQRFAIEYVRKIRNVFRSCNDDGFEAVKTDRGLGYKFCWKVLDDSLQGGNGKTRSKEELARQAKLAELTYFRYRDEKVEAINTSATSRVLAARYERDPVSIGDQIFPATIVCQNRGDLIDPDKILRTLDLSTADTLIESPTLVL